MSFILGFPLLRWCSLRMPAGSRRKVGIIGLGGDVSDVVDRVGTVRSWRLLEVVLTKTQDSRKVMRMMKMNCTCALSCMNRRLFISFAHSAQLLSWRVRTQAEVLHKIGHSGGKPPRMTQSSPVNSTGFPGTLTWRVVSAAPFSKAPIDRSIDRSIGIY